MGRFATVLLLAASMGSLSPGPTAHATDLNENPECQRMFDELARPIVQQLVWYASVANQSPVTPQGRPIVTGWPYSAYGPDNGYGPGSPYGPAFGPWGVGAFGPGAGGPALYGMGALGPGGPAWQFARNQVAYSVNNLAAAPTGLGFLAVANGIASQPPGLAPVGGLGGPGTADLLSLASLTQGQIGTALAAQGVGLTMVGNAQRGAGLMQSVIGNRMAAAELNATLTDFPLRESAHLGSAIVGILSYVSAVCPLAHPPSAMPEDNGDRGP